MGKVFNWWTAKRLHRLAMTFPDDKIGFKLYKLYLEFKEGKRMSRIIWGVETDPVTITRQKLIELAQPSAADWRSLVVVRANTKPKSKLANFKSLRRDK